MSSIQVYRALVETKQIQSHIEAGGIMMDTRNIWLDDATLRNLKSLSKKLVSPSEHVLLTPEEVHVVQKIQHGKILPAYLLTHFLPNGLSQRAHTGQ